MLISMAHFTLPIHESYHWKKRPLSDNVIMAIISGFMSQTNESLVDVSKNPIAWYIHIIGGDPRSLACTRIMYSDWVSRSRAFVCVVVMRPMWRSMANRGWPPFIGHCFRKYVTDPLLPLSGSVAITVSTVLPTTQQSHNELTTPSGLMKADNPARRVLGLKTIPISRQSNPQQLSQPSSRTAASWTASLPSGYYQIILFGDSGRSANNLST